MFHIFVTLVECNQDKIRLPLVNARLTRPMISQPWFDEKKMAITGKFHGGEASGCAWSIRCAIGGDCYPGSKCNNPFPLLLTPPPNTRGMFINRGKGLQEYNYDVEITIESYRKKTLWVYLKIGNVMFRRGDGVDGGLKQDGEVDPPVAPIAGCWNRYLPLTESMCSVQGTLWNWGTWTSVAKNWEQWIHWSFDVNMRLVLLVAENFWEKCDPRIRWKTCQRGTKWYVYVHYNVCVHICIYIYILYIWVYRYIYI